MVDGGEPPSLMLRPADGDGPPGIYFFTLDCNGLLPTIGAFLLFNLPYKLASMRRAEHSISSQRVGSAVAVQTQWEPLPEPDAPADDDQLGRFFVERYALYCTPGPLLRMFMSADSHLWCGTITHAPWPLRRVQPRHRRKEKALKFMVIGGRADMSPSPFFFVV